MDESKQWRHLTQAGKSASANVVLDPDIFNGSPAVKFDGVSGQYLSGAAGTPLLLICKLFLLYLAVMVVCVTTDNLPGDFFFRWDARSYWRKRYLIF